nr:urease isoform X1 [Tanacetum cinerariifolium]
RQVLPTVPHLLDFVQVEGNLPDGTKLITIYDPISSENGNLDLALHGSFLPSGGCGRVRRNSIQLISSLKESLVSKVMRECCFVVEIDAWLRGELTLSSLDVLQGLSFFLQMGFTLILATVDSLDVGLLGDVIGENDGDDDG